MQPQQSKASYFVQDETKNKKLLSGRTSKREQAAFGKYERQVQGAVSRCLLETGPKASVNDMIISNHYNESKTKR